MAMDWKLRSNCEKTCSNCSNDISIFLQNAVSKYIGHHVAIKIGNQVTSQPKYPP